MSDPITIFVLLLTGVACLFAFIKVQEKRKKITTNGIEVKGIIFQYDDDVVANDREPLPVIRFVTKEGEWITEKAEYVKSRPLLKEGQEVTVIYNSKNPKEFIYKTNFDLSLLYYLFLVGGLVCLVVGFLFAYKYLTKQS